MTNAHLLTKLKMLILGFFLFVGTTFLSAQNATWCTPIQISQTTGFNFITGTPEVVIVNGNPAVVFAREDDDLEIFYVRANDSQGLTWGAPQLVATGLNDNNGTSLAIINGNPAIAYHDRRGGGNHSLRYIRSNDVNGNSWGSIVVIESGGQKGQFCSLTTINGNPAISHHDGNSKDLRYSYSSNVNGSSGWSTVSIDTDFAGTFSKLLEVQGNPAIAYTKNQSGLVFDAKYVRATNSTGSIWGSPVNLTASINTTAGRFIDMEIVNGNPAIVFNETYHVTYENKTIYVRSNNNTGSSWGSLQTLFSSPGEDNEVRNQSIGFVNGVPVVAFHHIADPFNGGTRSLEYMSAMDANGANWNTPISAVTPEIVNYTDLIQLGTNAAMVYINSNESVKFITQGCVPPGPEIDVKGNSMSIADGSTATSTTDHTDFESNLTRTFTIENTGPGDLSITGITFSGMNASEFAVTSSPASTVVSGGNTTFEVTFTSAGSGDRVATVEIANSDSNESPYDFAIKADGFVPFETTWTGTSITIPTNSNYTYDYDVDWGDGTMSSNQTGDASHTYSTSGPHTVKISGDFPAIYFNNGSEKDKIQTIEAWGDVEWESMNAAFFGCSNLMLNATDEPDLSMAMSLNLMFALTSVNADISGWDVTTITNMASLFLANESFDQDLSNWNTANVTDMSLMFGFASGFDQSLAGLEIDNVTTMNNMLSGSGMSPANYDLTLTGWAGQSFPSNIALGANGRVYCASESDRTSLLNSGWTIVGDNKGCPITVPFITKWNVSSGQSITIPVAGGASDYTVDWGDGTIESGLVGNSTHSYSSGGTFEVKITGVFPGIRINNNAANRDKIVSIEQWGNNEWKLLTRAFFGASNLTNNASDVPNLGSITNLSLMFKGAEQFDADLGNWDVSNVTNMAQMLSSSGLSQTNYDNTLIGWSGQSVQNGVSLGTTDLLYCNSEVERSNLISMNGWTFVGDNVGCIITDAFATKWKTDVANETVTIPTFGGGYAYMVDWGDGTMTSNHTDDATHSYSVAGTYEVTITGLFPRIYLFGLNGSGRRQLVSIEKWGNNRWSSMDKAFFGASNLINNASDIPNTSNVDNMKFMFYSANLFDADLGSWDVSKVKLMHYVLDNSGLSTSNYDNTLIGWSGQSVQQGVVMSARNLEYCSAVSQRNDLISTNGWNIRNDSKCPPPKAVNPNQKEISIELQEFLNLEQDLIFTTFEQVRLFPNPTNGELTMLYDLSKASEVEILVRDVTGKLLFRTQQDGVLGENRAILNLSNYRNGMYLLQITNGEQNLTRKVVKH